MERNNRPHGRKKTTGSGTAHVGKGERIETGGQGVGAGRRREDTPSENRDGFPLGNILGNLIDTSVDSNSSGNSGSSGGDLLGSLLGGSSGSSSGHSSGSSGSSGGGLNLKKILIGIAVVIGIILLLRSCMGSGGLFSGLSGDLIDSDYSDTSNIDFNNVSYEDDAHASDNKPDLTVSSSARDKRVTPLGGGRDTVTIMLYMCGTDLESKYGMATKDLQEMLNAKISNKVNLIIETGGCSKWKNNTISSSKNQIYKAETGGLRTLESDAGTAAMTDPDNLTSFINYCEENYPADRYMLIFWDHGGGSLSGYGYDEKNPKASSMTLSKINSALKKADCTFDFIGFDACLMATLETALVCNNYADYLIGSEETEPGTGWYYTNWLTELSSNTSIPTVDLAQTIIDDFVSACTASSPSAKVTLSLVDLAELQGTVPDAFREFSTSTNELLHGDDYKLVSDARAGVRQFSKQSKINQVDLVDLARRIGTTESNNLAKALQGCVKYNRTTMSNCYGISIYFPYETTSSVKSAVASYQDLGIDDEYAKCIQSFASLEYGGQIAGSASQLPEFGSGGGDLLGTLISTIGGGSSSSSPLSVLLGGGSSSSGAGLDPSILTGLLGGFSGRSMPAEYDWVDTELIADHAEDIAAQYFDPSHLVITQKDGKNVLHLTDEEWELIQTVELNVFADDGEGYIDLGLDNTFDWYDDDLLLDYDGTWLTLNGNVCAYYLVSDSEQEEDDWTTVGRIPALLNGEAVNLRVIFDARHPDGVVTGAYPLYDDGLTEVQAKGEIPVVEGDQIQLLCDYYDYDGGFDASYTLGTAFTVPAGGLVLRNMTIDAQNVSVTYRLTDIYGNHYWTPVIE